MPQSWELLVSARILRTLFMESREIASNNLDRLAVPNARETNGLPSVEHYQPQSVAPVFLWAPAVDIAVLREARPRSMRGQFLGAARGRKTRRRFQCQSSRARKYQRLCTVRGFCKSKRAGGALLLRRVRVCDNEGAPASHRRAEPAR
jgi:hypothetical protein